MNTRRQLPVEVELALQVLPCQAMHRVYTDGPQDHACAHFGEWGRFHSYDYKDDGPPASPGITHPVVYAGKRPPAPEILSGCRKAPILAVGINPNLPGWSESTRNAIHPYFDDYLQYVHYFRWRATDKLRIPSADYRRLKGDRADGPFDPAPLQPLRTAIPVEGAPVKVYGAYQSLLEDLAGRAGWANHKLAVGEDLAYANMVACASARWTVRPDGDMPTMGERRSQEIVEECFHTRQYFLRQMLQSLPKVVIVFSQTTANAFITAMRDRFVLGNPLPQERIESLLQREIRLRLGTALDGEPLESRVIFSPHASSNPQQFEQQRRAIGNHLEDEFRKGRLVLNAATGHLQRSRGDCHFCENALYSIGPCDYRQELNPLRAPTAGMLALGERAAALDERAEHERLLREFTGAPLAPAPGPGLATLRATAPAATKLVLLGDVVTMAGQRIRRGAVYTAGDAIVAVQEEGAPPPPQFAGTDRVDTGGVIYPGLADLHNHLAYNILTLWWPKVARSNRSQWLRDREYRRLVSKPMAVVARRQDLLRALIRYVETKLLLGGVTSGQGMHSRFGGSAHFRGLVRNFEQSDDPRLPEVGRRVEDVSATDLPGLTRALDRGAPFFFHLAEGIDPPAFQQYALLRDHGLIRPNLAGIHSLGLRPEDLQAMAQAGASVIWSPLSNSILYGRSIPVKALLDSGVRFALGSDWTPSGSRNILQELKVAALAAEHEGIAIGTERLARAVTVDAMQIAGWGARLGRIEPGCLADLVVLDARLPDPHDNLVAATERDVRLVVIGGEARHGDRQLMEACGIPSSALEPIRIGGRDKALHLQQPGSPLDGLTFAGAARALQAALDDLHGTRDAIPFQRLSAGPTIEIELDMQAPEPDFEDVEDFDDLGLRAGVELPASVPLDGPTLVDDAAYWPMLDSIGHLPAFLKGANGLRRYY